MRRSNTICGLLSFADLTQYLTVMLPSNRIATHLVKRRNTAHCTCPAISSRSVHRNVLSMRSVQPSTSRQWFSPTLPTLPIFHHVRWCTLLLIGCFCRGRRVVRSRFIQSIKRRNKHAPHVQVGTVRGICTRSGATCLYAEVCWRTPRGPALRW